MDWELRKKINELYNLLDNTEFVKRLSDLNINNEVLDLINDYRLNPSVENKIKLYKNNEYLAYIKNETELN